MKWFNSTVQRLSSLQTPGSGVVAWMRRQRLLLCWRLPSEKCIAQLNSLKVEIHSDSKQRRLPRRQRVILSCFAFWKTQFDQSHETYTGCPKINYPIWKANKFLNIFCRIMKQVSFKRTKLIFLWQSFFIVLTMLHLTQVYRWGFLSRWFWNHYSLG